MNLTSILGGRPERKVADASMLTWDAILGAPSSKSGAEISITTALRVSTIFACCRVLAEDVSKVPLGLFRDMPDGAKKRATDHSLHQVLARRPNPWMTSFEFRETMMLHAVLCTAGHAWINRVGGRVVELIPLLPGNVITRQLADRSIVYEVSDHNGRIATLQAGDVFRVRGPSWSGVTGMEVMRQAQEAIGLAISTEESQARMHANGVQGGGILTTDAKLGKEAVDRIRGQFADNYSGSKSFSTKVLDNGLKFQSMMMTGVDAQHLETRKFQLEELCRFLRVHPTKVFQDGKAATYASREQNEISHVVDTLLPWFTRWEQAIDASLLTEQELADGYYAHFTVQGLLRGDSAGRAAYYKGGITDGWMTRNEARKLEELDPMPQLDAPLVPLNMQAVEPDDQGDAADPAEAGDTAPGPKATDPGAPAVQDTALNGAQVASLLAIVQAVADGKLPATTARAMIAASFPGVPAATIDEMLKALAGWEPEDPEPTDPIKDAAEDDTEDPAKDSGVKALAAALERGMASLGAGLAAKAEEKAVMLVRDTEGRVVGLKKVKG